MNDPVNNCPVPRSLITLSISISPTDRLRQRTVQLPIERKRVDRHASVVDGADPVDLDDARLGIDLNFSDHASVGEGIGARMRPNGLRLARA